MSDHATSGDSQETERVSCCVTSDNDSPYLISFVPTLPPLPLARTVNGLCRQDSSQIQDITSHPVVARVVYCGCLDGSAYPDRQLAYAIADEGAYTESTNRSRVKQHTRRRRENDLGCGPDTGQWRWGCDAGR